MFWFIILSVKIVYPFLTLSKRRISIFLNMSKSLREVQWNFYRIIAFTHTFWLKHCFKLHIRVDFKIIKKNHAWFCENSIFHIVYKRKLRNNVHESKVLKKPIHTEAKFKIHKANKYKWAYKIFHTLWKKKTEKWTKQI